ncbi:putative salutaridinol 7-O-acetyltransferase [Rosa chinensis]|uniref:Putative salutaridinol 7-O-acetyltransferase n=2 Tax=Rosa chinensis TaxID=74649 RepID=A0A2P6Q8W1_ROSCH|nr:putative salutaridinol 7-O-acetyltransferase [Rosa chinensis]
MGSEMTEIQVEVIHKETITPASPTPRNLTTCNLSVFDQFISDVYVRLLLVYPSSDVAHRHALFTDRSKLRKTSLSEALSRFYPYAGRTLIKNNIVSICCNEQGAAFIEAQVNCPISKVLEKPDLGLLKQLLPTATESTQESTAGYLLLVQANFFECGGVAIGVAFHTRLQMPLHSARSSVAGLQWPLVQR